MSQPRYEWRCWNAAFFTLEGSGQISAQVSTNPSPSQLTIDVPAPI
ncbi:hypothetical protein [Nocardia sp. NPDC046763]